MKVNLRTVRPFLDLILNFVRETRAVFSLGLISLVRHSWIVILLICVLQDFLNYSSPVLQELFCLLLSGGCFPSPGSFSRIHALIVLSWGLKVEPLYISECLSVVLSSPVLCLWILASLLSLLEFFTLSPQLREITRPFLGSPFLSCNLETLKHETSIIISLFLKITVSCCFLSSVWNWFFVSVFCCLR